MENYSYNSFAESGDSSPRSRELEFENTTGAAAPWEDQPLHLPSKVKFMCSYGGKIHPRPHDNQLSYIGGETKILSVDRSIKFSSLIAKLAALCDADVSFKYQLPGEDLDALISVTNDDDLEHMMHEYDRLCRPSAKPARLRLFLFPASSPTVGSVDTKTERERFVEALNSVPIQNVDATSSPPGTAPRNNVDFLFGLEKAVSPPPQAAKLSVPVPEPPVPAEMPTVINPGGEDRVFAADLGVNPVELQRQIQNLQRLQISAQEQGVNQRKSDDVVPGGYAGGDYYAHKMPEKAAPPSTIPATVPASYWQEKRAPGAGFQASMPAAPGLPDQPVYVISAPASVYHTPVARPVTGQTSQGYYAMRMGPDLYREQSPVYSVMQQPPVPATMPTPVPKLPTYTEGLGMVRPSGGGVADTGYTTVAYDSQGRQVYYSAPGRAVSPYQAMAAVSATSGPLSQESSK